MPSNKDELNEVFKCTQCGQCCKGYGGTFVNDDDILKIAKYLNITPQNVLVDYCQTSGGKPLLSIGENGYCIFWNKVCKIHPVKPRMCRTWPYIESVLIDSSNWHVMGSCCPGIREDAPYERIRAIIQDTLDRYL